MVEKKQAAVQKRQGIQDSNRTMFMWIAGASVLVGLAAVICWFLWQNTLTTMKVISAKDETLNIIKDNNQAAQELQESVRVLRTNTALLASRADPSDNAVRVVLDALPADPNSLALGASLQKKLLAGVSGVRIESLAVDPINQSEGVLVADNGETSSTNIITFSTTLSSSSADKLRDVLLRIERSIRVIDIDSMVFERSAENYLLKINARAYYEPAKEISLGERKLAQ